MKKISAQQQEIIKGDLNRSAELITDNLEKMATDKWIELGAPQDIIKRLKRKGHRMQAEQYMRFDEIRNNKHVLEKIDPTIKEVVSIPQEKINQIVKEGIIGSNNMISSYFLHKGSKVARSVGRISNKNTREALGTGFLISPNLIMTNNHVIPNKVTANACIIEFDFFSDNSGNPIKANEFELQPDRLFLTSSQNVFDFTLIAIQPINQLGVSVNQFGWIQLIEETGKAHIGERLNIIHHPLGQPQHISIRENLLVTHEESKIYLKYMTDTEPGSSGSPVLNDEWELVALHRASEIIENENQKQLYFQTMREIDEHLALQLKGKEVTINFGVRISTIANHIKTQLEHFSANQQTLLKEIFNNKSKEIGPLPFTSVDNTTPEKYSKGSATPMHININIGNKNYGSPEVTTSSPIVTNTTNEQKLKTQLEIFNNKINSQKSVFKALTFLEKAREKEYLPSAEDLDKIRNNYYEDVLQTIDNNHLTKKDLYGELHYLLSNTLTLVKKFPDVVDLESLLSTANLETLNLESGGVTYAKARAHLYTWVDLQEDRMLKGVYTQAAISPEQLLLKDLIQSLKIEGVELPRRFRNNQFLNCEHIVPKSLFNNDHLGFSDLHHLITAEGATNTFRNNRPYREFKDDEGKIGPNSLVDYIKPGGKSTSKYFEPLNNKALVARATLYFIVCHKEKLSATVYDKEAVATLINWSNSAAPSRYEQHRNESIFELQGNRNPFIDFPKWVEEVDFMEGLKK